MMIFDEPVHDRVSELPAHWTSYPGALDWQPRDGLRLDRTADLLFLACIVANFTPPIRWLTRLTLPDRGKSSLLLLEDNEGGFYHPATRQPTRPDGFPEVKQKYYGKTLRRQFKERYYHFRSLALKLQETDLTIKLDGRTICHAGDVDREGFCKLEDQLVWPLRTNEDPLLGEGGLSGIEFKGCTALPHREGERNDPICPVDGPVWPVVADIISPEWTWRNLCGRHWRTILCPRCLGQFHTDLVALN
jgi:hypothetical protein